MSDTRKQVTEIDSMEMRRLNQLEGMRTNEILERYQRKGYSKSTILRHMKREINDEVLDKRLYNKGVTNIVPKNNLKPQKSVKKKKKYQKMPLTLSVSLRICI